MKFATIFTSLFDEMSEASAKRQAEKNRITTRLKVIKSNLDVLESEEPFEEIKMAA
jgi:hypothetical protein